MALQFYDSTKTLFSGNPLKTSLDGRYGSVRDSLIYVKNNDVSKYYTNLSVSTVYGVYPDAGEFSNTGWSVKYLYGERRPTEAEWDTAKPDVPLALPDIGSTVAADTTTYHPIWVRVIAPAAPAQRRSSQTINITGRENNVGS